MNVRVKFLGGAGSVTGSKYLIDIDDFRLLVDCGMFQGLKELRLRNWEEFPVDPKTIDAVVLTHAHIDHTGLLPKLFKEGYSNPVYCTSATGELLPIMLRDAAKLQEEEAGYAKKKGFSKHANPLPLYTIKDAELALTEIVGIPFHEEVMITDGVHLKFYNAGHILGASIVELILDGNNQTKKIIFSGDLGPYGNPLHYDPEEMNQADILFVESTYGNRTGHNATILEDLHQLMERCQERGGSLVVPAFSVGRTQLMLYYFWKLRQAGKMPKWPIYVDSPMAISVTGLYRRHSNLHRLTDDDLDDGHYIFDNPAIHYLKDQSASKSLNELTKQCVIISASGMVTGGRILHHLYHRLRNPNDTVLFTGYQAEGSRGRRILEGETEIKMLGEMVPVKAHIEAIEGFSAHGDREDLLRWLGQFEQSPKITFIVHGEKESSSALGAHLKHEKKWNVMIPEYQESVQLFDGI